MAKLSDVLGQAGGREVTVESHTPVLALERRALSTR